MLHKNPWRGLLLACLALGHFTLAQAATPVDLFKAADAGDAAKVNSLIAQGVPVDSADPDGWTPLMVAAAAGKLPAVQALVKAGADVNARTKRGETPLVAAALSGNIAIVKLLLSEGADKTVVTEQGLTAADVARKAKHENLSKLLAVSVAAATAPATTAQPRGVEAKVNAAADAFKAGSYVEAARLFKEVVAIDPKHALAWHFLGQSLTKTGDNKGARAAYGKALEIQPTGPVAERTRTLVAQLPVETLKDCLDCPEMVEIPAGSFEMGSPSDEAGRSGDEGPVHRVNLRGFALAKTEVTQGQWRAIMGNNPSHFSSCGDDCPVDQVSWDDAQEYVRKLSQRTGKIYRLPSEAEWEYACRAGGRQQYCGSDSIDGVAWYHGNSGSRPHLAGQKQRNAFGLSDMSGNVREWVEDCWHYNYSGAPTDGSAWTTAACTENWPAADTISDRVLRGGSWSSSPQDVRSAGRSWNAPAFRYYNIGFRPARMLP